MNLIPYLAMWAVLAIVVVVLAVYRKMIFNKTDEILHLAEAEQTVSQHQVVEAKRLESIDRWGKSLTVVLLLAGLAIAAAYIYQLWNQTYNP